ncbi:Aec26 [Salmonella enterica subsp. houtenae]|nr:Aec26 [Salmonella enterica subsp. houtenae]
MIDAATPLLGMVMRVSDMNSNAMPEHLFTQVVTDVQAVEQLLQEQGYEPGVIVSFRYILCTFIDEAALGNGWSNKNEWIKQSLLVHFHNEAWGGEKVFILLERLIREPARYQHLLEFLYICFSLGFRGATKSPYKTRMNLNKSTAVCTTFCTSCAAMRLSAAAPG